MAANEGMNPWSTDWMDAQKRYWDAWSTLAALTPGQPAPGVFAPPSFPWGDGLEHWWKAVSGGVPAESREYCERLMTQSKGFLQFAELLMRTLQGASEAAKAGEDWRRRLEEQFNSLKGLLTGSSTESAAAMQGLLGFAQLPLDTWRRVCSGLSLTPGDAMQNLRAASMEHFGEKFHADLDRFLSVPGVGYTREAQEELQKGARLLLDYQRVFQEYVLAHEELVRRTLDRLLQRLTAMGEKGEQVTTLRQLYDVWVDAGEEAYAEFVMRPEFAELYGRLVNALMAVKRHGREMVDESLGALNMPTREELNTVLDRQQQLRRQVRELQRAGATGGAGARSVEALEAEIAQLRAELAQARRAARPEADVAETAQPSPARAAQPAARAAEPAPAPAASPAPATAAEPTVAVGSPAAPAKAPERAAPSSSRASAPEASAAPSRTRARPAGRRSGAGSTKAWDISSLVPGALEPAVARAPTRRRPSREDK